MGICLVLFLTGCPVTSVAVLRLPEYGPHPLRVSYIENILRVGFPLIAQPKSDGDGYRSTFEIQVGTRFTVSDYHLDVETVEGGIFLRF